MKSDFIHVYNNFVNLTRNKSLYIDQKKQDTFSDRLTMFLIHFAFFLKIFKNEDNKKDLQALYDFIFRQFEMSIREIGYGDQTINKKMKVYINLFHDIISQIDYWDSLDINEKIIRLKPYFNDFDKIDHLVRYFDEFFNSLSKYSLKSFIKSVSK